MTRRATIAALSLFVLFSSALVAQTMNMRPGQWQWTISMKGNLGDMSKLPPEVAKQMAAELSKPHTTVDCITAEEIKKGWNGAYESDEDDECKVTSRKAVGNAIDVVRACAGDRPRTETAHFEFASPEAMRGTVTITGGRSGTMTLAGKWLAGACKD